MRRVIISMKGDRVEDIVMATVLILDWVIGGRRKRDKQLESSSYLPCPPPWDQAPKIKEHGENQIF